MVKQGGRQFTLIAGTPILDLVNTVAWRGDPSRRRDDLDSIPAAVTWCTLVGVLCAEEAKALARDFERSPANGQVWLDDLHSLRDQVADVLDAGWTEAAPGLAGVVQDTLAAAKLQQRSGSELGPGLFAWVVEEGQTSTAQRRLVLDLYSLLTQERGRVGLCADNDCRWAFVDRSRARRRKWCSSENCGNRARVRAHTRRAHT